MKYTRGVRKIRHTSELIPSLEEQRRGEKMVSKKHNASASNACYHPLLLSCLPPRVRTIGVCNSRKQPRTLENNKSLTRDALSGCFHCHQDVDGDAPAPGSTFGDESGEYILLPEEMRMLYCPLIMILIRSNIPRRLLSLALYGVSPPVCSQCI